jgi:hypothetical protein
MTCSETPSSQAWYGDAEVVVELIGRRPLQAREVGDEVAIDAAAVWDDDHFSSVAGVDLAADESPCFEPIDHTGDGTGGQSGELREPSRGSGPVEQKEA